MSNLITRIGSAVMDQMMAVAPAGWQNDPKTKEFQKLIDKDPGMSGNGLRAVEVDVPGSGLVLLPSAKKGYATADGTLVDAKKAAYLNEVNRFVTNKDAVLKAISELPADVFIFVGPKTKFGALAVFKASNITSDNYEKTFLAALKGEEVKPEDVKGPEKKGEGASYSLTIEKGFGSNPPTELMVDFSGSDIPIPSLTGEDISVKGNFDICYSDRGIGQPNPSSPFYGTTGNPSPALQIGELSLDVKGAILKGFSGKLGLFDPSISAKVKTGSKVQSAKLWTPLDTLIGAKVGYEYNIVSSIVAAISVASGWTGTPTLTDAGTAEGEKSAPYWFDDARGTGKLEFNVILELAHKAEAGLLRLVRGAVHYGDVRKDNVPGAWGVLFEAQTKFFDRLGLNGMFHYEKAGDAGSYKGYGARADVDIIKSEKASILSVGVGAVSGDGDKTVPVTMLVQDESGVTIKEPVPINTGLKTTGVAGSATVHLGEIDFVRSALSSVGIKSADLTLSAGKSWISPKEEDPAISASGGVYYGVTLSLVF